MTILADHKKLIYSGRIDWSNPLEPIFVFPCTFVKMKFTGNVLKVHVKNRNAYWNNYLGVILDGEQSCVLLPKDGEALLDIPVKESEKTEHEVMIFKRQDSCHELTFLGFELGEEQKSWIQIHCRKEESKCMEILYQQERYLRLWTTREKKTRNIMANIPTAGIPMHG